MSGRSPALALAAARYRSPQEGQASTRARVRGNGMPQRQAQPTRRAGTPATSANGGTSRVTTAPAATSA